MVQKIRSRGKKVDVPPEDRERIVQLYRQGLGYTKISDQTGYSRWTVAETVKAAGVSRPRGTGGDGASAVQQPVVARAAPTVRAPVGPAKPVRRSRRGIKSPSELSAELSAAATEARQRANELTNVANELEELWVRADNLAQQEAALKQALAAIRVLRQRVEQYRKQVAEAEERNVKRAMTVHSEGSRVESGE